MKREDKSARDVFESLMFLRPFEVDGGLFRGGCGGGVDRHCSDVTFIRLDDTDMAGSSDMVKR